MRGIRGLTMIELLIVLAVVILLVGGAVTAFSHSTNAKSLSSAADAVVFTLEQAKSEALAGKNGVAHGVHFATSSYTVFAGSTYDTGDPEAVYTLPNGLSISTELSGSTDVTFARLTGDASETGTLTVSDGSNTKTISIGSAGDVSVIQ